MKIKIKKIIMFILTVIIRLFLLLVVVITFFVAKDVINSRTMFKKTSLLSEGHIIHTDNINWVSTVYSTDLRTRETEILYKSSNEPYFSDTEVASLKAKGVEGLLEARNFAENNKEKGIVTAITISKLDGDWVLFGMDYYSGGYKIYKFNIKTKELIFLRDGFLPTYLPKYNKLVFFMSKKQDKEFSEDGLCVVDMDSLNKPKFISAAPIRYSRIVPVSDSEVVFRSNRNYETLIYNVKTDEVKVLPFSNCYAPIAWRDKSKQLLCIGEDGYFFTGLEGKRTENIVKKIGKNIRMHVNMYISEKDLIIIFKGDDRFYWKKNWKDGLGIAPLWDMWVYDVVSGKKEVLIRDISWPIKSAIYLPD